MLELKPFQHQVITQLQRFITRLRHGDDPCRAFATVGAGTYRDVPAVAAPCVAVQVPTGGGKTFLAAIACGVIADGVYQPRPTVVVWLVPSTVLAEQTITQLRDPAQPLAQVLRQGSAGLGGLGTVRVVDVTQALRLPASVYATTSVVVVATIQQFRVHDPVGRQVYADNELVADGAAQSLVAVLARRRPVLIIDEAHHAHTPLSFTTVARLAPSFVLEFSATPPPPPWPANVLCRVAASTLKNEHLLKLPLLVTTNADPQRCLRDAVAQRQDLARRAAVHPGTAQPLLLIQAEADRQAGAWTPAVVKSYLCDRLGLRAEEIAIATANERGLRGIDLRAPQQPLTTIITIEALREGWDCPAAAVLCTLRGSFTATAAVQLVGRIIRQPGARLHADEHLNRSYAFAVASDFTPAIAALRDCLQTQFGFSAADATYVQAHHPAAELAAAPALPSPAATTSTAPMVWLPLQPPLVLPQLMIVPDLDNVVCGADTAAASATRTSEPTTWEVFRDHHRLAVEWHLSPASALLPPGLYQPGSAAPGHGLIDVDDEGEWTFTADESPPLVENAAATDHHVSERAELAWWCEQRLCADDIHPAELRVWVAQALDYLQQQRGLSLVTLDHDRLRLVQALREQLTQQRETALRAATAQLLHPSRVRASDAANHAMIQVYPVVGGQPSPWAKHAHPFIAPFDSSGEVAIATWLEQQPRVRRWLRNLHYAPGFALPRCPLAGNGWFYPDFIVERDDGRWIVIEAKGSHLSHTLDTNDKCAAATLWATTTGNGFVVIIDHDLSPLHQVFDPE